MDALTARHLERQATKKRRSDLEKKQFQLTYRGVPYCKPCKIEIAYY
jgi:hypothetical protein